MREYRSEEEYESETQYALYENTDPKSGIYHICEAKFRRDRDNRKKNILPMCGAEDIRLKYTGFYELEFDPGFDLESLKYEESLDESSLCVVCAVSKERRNICGNCIRSFYGKDSRSLSSR